ncbi:MAG TPA: TIGR03435 family protein, partial [Bryobacteraceae bacterium]|nr:TIGR03435 family protein [Bryobacteraceae bacterium]
RRETKELPVYTLVIAKNGPKLQEAKSGDSYANGYKRPDGRPVGGTFMRMGKGEIDSQGTPMDFLVQQLARQVGRTVVDQTGLKGKYDFTLKWTPDPGTPAGMVGPPAGGGRAPDNSAPPDTSGPSIFTAVQEQLGLKLESTKGPVEIIVIDHIERPSEN